MRVLVVGATGVLGRALLPLLAEQGHTIRALVRTADQAERLTAAGVETVRGDLLDGETQGRLAEFAAGCDAIIHAATAIPRDRANTTGWEQTARLRTEGARALLDAAVRAGAGRYVQQSIIMAYADGGDDWLDESTPLASGSRLSSIATMEELVRGADPGLTWCILRGGQFVGPETAQDDLLARLRAGEVIVPGDGGHFLSPVHVADVATAFAAALAAPPSSTYHVVDAPIRYGEYVDRLAALVGAPSPPRDPDQPRPPSWRCSNAAAQAALGWRPTHGIWPALPVDDPAVGAS